MLLWPAVRDAVRGGWAKRGENAVAWFLVVWVAFVFLFFSKSQSKLPPYILPVFPPLAVLIGPVAGGRDGRSDWGAGACTGACGFSSFACGLLAAGTAGGGIAAGARDQGSRTGARAAHARDGAGGRADPGRRECANPRAACAGRTRRSWRIALTAAVVSGGPHVLPVPDIYKPGTKELALIVKAQVKPGDRVMHYFDFFHDFTFYAERTVDLSRARITARKLEFSELEFKEDAAARARGQLHDRGSVSGRFGRNPAGSTWLQRKRTCSGGAMASRHSLPIRRSIIICSPNPRTTIFSAISPDMSTTALSPSNGPTQPAGRRRPSPLLPFLPFTRPVIDEDTIAGVAEVLRSGWITSGPKVKAFEAKLSEFCGGRPVRVFNSGTCTMEIALRIAGIGPGDEVITTPLTWVATSNVVLEVGARPVYVDIDPGDAQHRPEPHRGRDHAGDQGVLPVDLAGLPVDRDQLHAIAKKHKLRVIEDAAQSFGSTWKGKRIRLVRRFRVVQFSSQQERYPRSQGGCLRDERRARGQTRRSNTRLQGVVRTGMDGMEVELVAGGGKFNLTDVAARVGLFRPAAPP